MTAAPAKFRFDLDLGHQRRAQFGGHRKRASPRWLPTPGPKVASDGIAEGQRSAAVKAAAHRPGRRKARRPHRGAQRRARRSPPPHTVADALGLAASIGRKLASHLLAAEPVAEIEALITECLASLDAVPHLVIRCNPEVADTVREIASARIANSGFAGRLVVIGDPDMQPGRRQASNGPMAASCATAPTLEPKSTDRIAHYVAARRGHGDKSRINAMINELRRRRPRGNGGAGP